MCCDIDWYGTHVTPLSSLTGLGFEVRGAQDVGWCYTEVKDSPLCRTIALGGDDGLSCCEGDLTLFLTNDHFELGVQMGCFWVNQ